MTTVCYYTFTHPEHRRRGAGHLMMEWATKKADELGLEIYIEESPLGSILHTKHGFGILEITELNPPREMDENNDEWSWRERTTGLRCETLKTPRQWEMVGRRGPPRPKLRSREQRLGKTVQQLNIDLALYSIEYIYLSTALP